MSTMDVVVVPPPLSLSGSSPLPELEFKPRSLSEPGEKTNVTEGDLEGEGVEEVMPADVWVVDGVESKKAVYVKGT